MIKSILDTDLYKFTTSYAYMKLYPNASGTFTFVDRNKRKYSAKEFSDIQMALDDLSRVSLSDDELNWVVSNIKFIPQFYWEWLKQFRFDFSKIRIWLDSKDQLQITVTDKLYKVTLYEVPILAIVSEVVSNKNTFTANAIFNAEIKPKLDKKLEIARKHDFKFSEFGTRRRFSCHTQDLLIKYLYDNGKDVCTGTSNVYFAYKNNWKVMGTHPHEWFMFHGAQFGYKHANYLAMTAWQDVYDGDLGIALTDTYGSDNFFVNFSKKLAKLFDGIRQDSGDELVFADKAVARYVEHGIDPLTKTIIFSNALNFHKAAMIADYCKGKIKYAFGIGTNLTNDIDGTERSNIVMKLTECKMNDNATPMECIKLSDDKGKHLGSDVEVATAKYVLGIKD